MFLLYNCILFYISPVFVNEPCSLQVSFEECVKYQAQTWRHLSRFLAEEFWLSWWKGLVKLMERTGEADGKDWWSWWKGLVKLMERTGEVDGKDWWSWWKGLMKLMERTVPSIHDYRIMLLLILNQQASCTVGCTGCIRPWFTGCIRPWFTGCIRPWFTGCIRPIDLQVYQAQMYRVYQAFRFTECIRTSCTGCIRTKCTGCIRTCWDDKMHWMLQWWF